MDPYFKKLTPPEKVLRDSLSLKWPFPENPGSNIADGQTLLD